MDSNQNQNQQFKKLNQYIQPVDEKKFRINRRDIFLTYPNVGRDFTLDELLEFLKDKFKQYTILYIIVCVEKHLNGVEHFHSYALTRDKFNFTNCKFADLAGHHAHILKPRSSENIVKYIKKEGNILEFGFYNDSETKRRQKNQDLTKEVQQLGLYKSSSQGLISLLQVGQIQKSLQILEIERQKDLFNERLDLEELDFQFFTQQQPTIRFKFDIDYKQKHYYIYGQPNSGKTTFAKKLLSEYKAIRASYTNNWTQMHEYVQVIVFDEYTGELAFSALNGIADSLYSFNVKCGAFDMPQQQHPIIIIMSNFTIQEIFDKLCATQIQVEAFLKRFNIVVLENNKHPMYHTWNPAAIELL